jgi:hypothetical protein
MLPMDRLSPELRTVEREIDEAYKSNPLAKACFSVAAWNLLAATEDRVFSALKGGEETNRFRLDALIDHLMFIIRNPIYWLRISCPPGGQIPRKFNRKDYEAAQDLLRLASQYDDFYMVFTYASRGLIDLRLEGNDLIPTGTFTDDSQYEAYNRLVKPINVGFTDEALHIELERIGDPIITSLKVAGENFSFSTNPHLVNVTIELFQSILQQKFTLPDSWLFSRYSMLDFRKVFSAIFALAYLQYVARFLAVESGCKWNGITNGVLIARRLELIARVVRYTGLRREVVKEIIFDLTLGSNEIPPDQADPAQQPLVPLDPEHYAIMPHLWINNAAERNFVVLLNKLPKEKPVYLKLVHLKEEIMRKRIVEGIVNSGLRTWWGPVSTKHRLPDIDLAILSPEERICLFLELKWFIDPAEPRELLEKSGEIRKGISQLQQIKKAFSEHDNALISCLGIDSAYSVGFAVVSANWIGHASEQHADIPVIREHHLIKKLASAKTLLETINWLSKRQYLPTEGVDYEVITTSSTVGRWNTHWYGFKPLIRGHEFLPL